MTEIEKVPFINPSGFDGALHFETVEAGVLINITLEGDALSALTYYIACDHSRCSHDLLWGFIWFCSTQDKIAVIERCTSDEIDKRLEDLLRGHNSVNKHKCQIIIDDTARVRQ